MKELFQVHQKITVFANEYRVLKDIALVGYVKQKRFALREKFTLFNDEHQSAVVATSQARKVLDISGAFDVLNDHGGHLATLKKEFKSSIFNSTWTIYKDEAMQNLVFTLREKNQFVAILRRLWNFIPYANDIPFFIRFHFVVLSGTEVVGEYNKITTLRDHYSMNLNEAHIATLDERAWMIMAVLLDAMQNR